MGDPLTQTSGPSEPTFALLRLQLEYLDTLDDGVGVSRQALGSGQFRWTVTFMDAGDDFELEDVVARDSLNATAGGTSAITCTKVGHLASRYTARDT